MPRQEPNHGKSENHWTPPHVFEALGMRFVLDPAAPPGGVPWVPADMSYSREDDGLAMSWDMPGHVWLNPPYGADVAPWLGRLAEHGDGIALVFARTDVDWWHQIVPRATAVCFIKRRLQFVDGATGRAQDNAPAASALIAFGFECAAAVDESGLGMTFPVPVEHSRGRLW